MKAVAYDWRARADERGSEHELWFRVDLLEGSSSTLVKNLLGWKALVFVEVVGSHASSELVDIFSAELG